MKGRAKVKFDRVHKVEIEAYPKIREQLNRLLNDGEQLSPKQWNWEIKSLQSEYAEIRKSQAQTIHDLAYAEVIDFNKKNLDRELSNESHSKVRSKGMNKRKDL